MRASRSKVRHGRPDVALVALGLLGATVGLLLTRSGIAMDADSAVYLGRAQNLASGRGPTVPMTFFTDHYTPAQAFAFHGRVPSTHFPPLYSGALAFFEIFGAAGDSAARIVAVVLSAVNLVLVGTVVRQVLRRSDPLRTLSGAIVVLLLSPWLLAVGFALSDALLLTCMLGALLAVSRFVDTQARSAFLLTAICSIGAVLTRWVGISVGITAAALVLGQRAWPLGIRLRRAAIIGASTLGAALLWTLYGVVVGHAAPRELAYHPAPRFFETIVNVLGIEFFHPFGVGVQRVLLLLAATTLVAGVARSRRRVRSEPLSPRGNEPALLIRCFAAFAACYLAIVFLARTFFDASIPLMTQAGSELRAIEASRILLPLLVALVVLALVALDVLTREQPVNFAVGCLVAAAVLTPYAWTSLRAIPKNAEPVTPRAGSMAVAVNGLPASTMIVTDTPSNLFLGTGRDMLSVPPRVYPVTAEANRDYVAQIGAMFHILCGHNGVLAVSLQPSIVHDFARIGTLTLLGQYTDGAIYHPSC